MQAEIHNQSLYSLEEINGFERLATTLNKWLCRNVTLFQHPEQEDLVISVGTTYDKSLIVVAVDPKPMWEKALDYATAGKVYVSN